MNNWVISGAAPSGGATRDLYLTDGRFADEPASGATVVDAAGLIALPGLVDLHTHLREPASSRARTVLTGSRAAAAGGFTAVHAMANTSPVAETAGVVEQVWSLGAHHGYVTVRPVGAVTMGLKGERLSEIGAMAGSRARVRVFSDDGKCVSDALPHASCARIRHDLRRRRRAARAGAAAHRGGPDERGSAVGRTRPRRVARGRRGGDSSPATCCSPSTSAHGCTSATCRRRARSMSSAWAKGRGIAVTAEVTPQPPAAHGGAGPRLRLALQGQPPRCGARRMSRRCGPPSPTARFDIVANRPRAASAGVEGVRLGRGRLRHGPGLESALGVVQLAMVDSGLLGWADVARVLSAKPAQIGGLPATTTLRPSAARRTSRCTTPRRTASSDSATCGQGAQLALPRPRASRPDRRDIPRRLPPPCSTASSSTRRRSPPMPSTTLKGAQVPSVFTLLSDLDIGRQRDSHQAPGLRAHRVAVIITLAALGWTARRRRQRAIPATEPMPLDPGELRGEFDGFYVSTTLDGQPLTRVAVRGLGFRSRATVAVVDAGVILALPGNDIFIPRATIREVTRANYTIDRVVEPGGPRAVGLAARRGQARQLLSASSRRRRSSRRSRGCSVRARCSPPTRERRTSGGRSRRLRSRGWHRYTGLAYGARGRTFGEAVFATGMSGYQETLTDPSYAGQIVVMTAPHIGNTGVNDEDPESSRIWVAGYVVRDPSRIVSNYRRPDRSATSWSREGRRDQRHRHPCDHAAASRRGRHAGRIFSVADSALPADDQLRLVRESASMLGQNLSATVSTADGYSLPAEGERIGSVAVLDLGVKTSTLRYLAARGFGRRRRAAEHHARSSARGRTGRGLLLQRTGRPRRLRPARRAAAGRAARGNCRSSASASATSCWAVRSGSAPTSCRSAIAESTSPSWMSRPAAPRSRATTTGSRSTPRSGSSPIRRRASAGRGEPRQPHDNVVEGLNALDIPALLGAVPPEAAAGPARCELPVRPLPRDGRGPAVEWGENARRYPRPDGRVAGEARVRDQRRKVMPKRDDINSVLVIGSGPIVIGQAAESTTREPRPAGCCARRACGSFSSTPTRRPS